MGDPGGGGWCLPSPLCETSASVMREEKLLRAAGEPR